MLTMLRRGFFDKVGRDWEAAWTNNVTPWELKSVNPSFVEGLSMVEHKGRALVPGCGSGYDLLHLSTQGWSATGLDISSTAVHQATKVVGDKCTLEQGDFYAYTCSEPYDLIYDYLFFAAINPEMRQKCAQQFHDLLTPKTGVLLTLLFPLKDPKSFDTNGPPYQLSLEDYQEIFKIAGLELKTIATPKNSIKPRQGRELLAFWQRK
ncbi:thiocyanate methyltransferase 1-like [Thraustotheca clavata]|uniref:Thiocyanate methyltransferase 1-like n=1 Tax=Thraustotheca clavata TaxID=74557 RepID=A0A1V9YXS6_9STRA|nr:thiocyanate methyltransferase 1-like [Thraustotheca clavata]